MLLGSWPSGHWYLDLRENSRRVTSVYREIVTQTTSPQKSCLSNFESLSGEYDSINIDGNVKRARMIRDFRISVEPVVLVHELWSCPSIELLTESAISEKFLAVGLEPIIRGFYEGKTITEEVGPVLGSIKTLLTLGLHSEVLTFRPNAATIPNCSILFHAGNGIAIDGAENSLQNYFH